MPTDAAFAAPASAALPRKILIDTDPGQDIDDLLSIHFALLRSELDVRAITTVTWPARDRLRLIRRLLRYMGREEIPVAAGMDLPLRHFDEAEWEWTRNPRNTMNHSCFAEPCDPRDAHDPASPDAVELIIRTVEANPGEVMLAAIAPLTNIACALQRRPDIAEMIPAIALMGGELTLPRGEHNIAHDYVAADIVLRSGIPVVMGTWDVTRRFVIGNDDRARMAGHSCETVRALAAAIAAWHPAHSWKPGAVMYDIFPIIHAMDPTGPSYTLRQTSVRVDTTGEFTRGHTVRHGTATHIHVTTDMNAPAVRELYLRTVLGE